MDEQRHEEDLEKFRQKIIEEERQRLLKEHATRLLGYLPKVCRLPLISLIMCSLHCVSSTNVSHNLMKSVFFF